MSLNCEKIGLIQENAVSVEMDNEHDGDAAWAQPDFLQTKLDLTISRQTLIK